MAQDIGKCYEYLGCFERECIMYGRNDDEHCWDVDGTLCNNHVVQLIREKFSGKKEDACARSQCLYYNTAKDRASYSEQEEEHG
jgi:hypothetical protein